MTITIWTRAIRLLKNLNDSMLMLNSMLIFMHIVAFTIQFFIHFLFTCVFVYTPFHWHSTPLHSIAVSPFVSLMELISICLMSTLSSASFSLTYILCVVLYCIVSHIFCWWYSLSIVTILIQSTNKWQKNTLFEWWQKKRKTYHSYLSLSYIVYMLFGKGLKFIRLLSEWMRWRGWGSKYVRTIADSSPKKRPKSWMHTRKKRNNKRWECRDAAVRAFLHTCVCCWIFKMFHHCGEQKH